MKYLFHQPKKYILLYAKNPCFGTLIVVGAVFIVLIYKFNALTKINEIESLNQEYEILVQEINGYQKANGTLRTNTDNIRNLLKESINPVNLPQIYRS